MALVTNNDLTLGLRGKMGEFVYRRINGKTFSSRAPRKPDKSKETVRQRQTRNNFRDASAWAKRVLLDPEQKAFYTLQAHALELPNAYTAAIKAFMAANKKPAIRVTQHIHEQQTWLIFDLGSSLHVGRLLNNANHWDLLCGQIREHNIPDYGIYLPRHNPRNVSGLSSGIQWGIYPGGIITRLPLTTDSDFRMRKMKWLR
jgi:hypothetical protein